VGGEGEYRASRKSISFSLEERVAILPILPNIDGWSHARPAKPEDREGEKVR